VGLHPIRRRPQGRDLLLHHRGKSVKGEGFRVGLGYRELDAFIAEKLLGYVWAHSHTGKCRALVPSDFAQGCTKAQGDEPLCLDGYASVPNLSTTYQGMGMVEPAMLKRGWRLCLNRAHGFVAGFYHDDYEPVFGEDDAAPRAVALAAKAALEEEK